MRRGAGRIALGLLLGLVALGLTVVGLTASFQPTISLGAAGVSLGLIAAILANPQVRSLADSPVPVSQ